MRLYSSWWLLITALASSIDGAIPSSTSLGFAYSTRPPSSRCWRKSRSSHTIVAKAASATAAVHYSGRGALSQAFAEHDLASAAQGRQESSMYTAERERSLKSRSIIEKDPDDPIKELSPEKLPTIQGALPPHAVIEVELEAIGAWSRAWDAIQCSLALSRLSRISSPKARCPLAEQIISDSRFSLLLQRIESLIPVCNCKDVTATLNGLGRLAIAGPFTPSRNLISALAMRASYLASDLSGRDLSVVIHALGKLLNGQQLHDKEVATVGIVVEEARRRLDINRAKGGSPQHQISPRDLANMIIGMGLLSRIIVCRVELIKSLAWTAAAEVMSLSSITSFPSSSSKAPPPIITAQDLVGIAEGMARVATSLSSKEREAGKRKKHAAGRRGMEEEEDMILALAALGQSIATVTGLAEAAYSNRRGVVRIWRPKDRARLQQALVTLMAGSRSKGEDFRIGDHRGLQKTIEEEEEERTIALAKRSVLHSRILKARTVADIQGALVDAEEVVGALDHLCLATAIQKLGRFCTSQAKEQSLIRPWLVTFTHRSVGPILNEKSFDGRSLTSLVDGLAMLGVEGLLASDDLLNRALDTQLLHLLEGKPVVAIGPQEALRLYPALVRLGFAQRPGGVKLLPLICRSAALGSSSTALVPLSRLIYSIATSRQALSARALPADEAAVYRALLRRVLLLLQASPSKRHLKGQDVANLANAMGSLAEAIEIEEEEMITNLFHDISLALIDWENEASDAALNSLSVAKFVGGLSKMKTTRSSSVAEWAQGPRFMARVAPRLLDMHVRSLSTVIQAMMALQVIPNQVIIRQAREALTKLTASSIGGQPVDGKLKQELIDAFVRLLAMSSAVQEQVVEAAAASTAAAVTREHLPILLDNQRHREILSLSLMSIGGPVINQQKRKRNEEVLVTAQHPRNDRDADSGTSSIRGGEGGRGGGGGEERLRIPSSLSLSLLSSFSSMTARIDTNSRGGEIGYD